MEGTLARDLLSNPKEVKSSRGKKLSLNATVDSVSFAGVCAYVCVLLVDVVVHGDARSRMLCVCVYFS